MAESYSNNRQHPRFWQIKNVFILRSFHLDLARRDWKAQSTATSKYIRARNRWRKIRGFS